MDGELAGLALAGLAAGVKVAGSFVARRLGPQAQERWESFTNTFWIKAARICAAIGAAIFWGALAAISGKYLLQSLFSVEISEHELLALLLLIAFGVFLWLYPRTSKLFS